MRPGWSRKLKVMTDCTTPMAMPAKKARGNETIPAMTAAARARTKVFGPRLSRFWADPAWPARRASESVASPPASAHTAVETAFGTDAEEAGEVGVLGGGLHRFAQRRPVEQPSEAEGDERDHDEDRELRAEHADPGDVVHGSDRHREADAGARRSRGRRDRIASESWAMPMVATSTITRGASNSRRITASSTIAPYRTPTSRPIDRRQPERHAVLRHEEREETGADEAEVGDREVDDPRGPVDEHDAHRHEPEHHPGDGAVEEELPGEPTLEQRRVHAGHPPSWPRNTARARSSRSSSSRAFALEAHLALLEEDGAVGHRQGHVERLLDDDDRGALALEPLDDLQQLLHHDRRRDRARARR